MSLKCLYRCLKIVQYNVYVHIRKLSIRAAVVANRSITASMLQGCQITFRSSNFCLIRYVSVKTYASSANVCPAVCCHLLHHWLAYSVCAVPAGELGIFLSAGLINRINGFFSDLATHFAIWSDLIAPSGRDLFHKLYIGGASNSTCGIRAAEVDFWRKKLGFRFLKT